MTETSGPNGRLADAFRALEDPDAPVSDELRERIWQAVSGTLPAEERRQIVDRMATDPACAEAWRVAHEMWLASQRAAPEGAAAPVPRHGRRWTAPWLAAAAVLLVGTTIGLVSLRESRLADEYRSVPVYVVQSLVPEQESLSRDAFVLRWAAGPAGSRYQVRVTTDDLAVLATAADLAVPQFTVPAGVLAPLPNGATVLWQVDAYLPDGQRTTSRTFVARLR